MPFILVVDNDASTHKFVEPLVRDRGHRMVSAKDGALGLSIIVQARPDLIIFDVSLPILDGWAMWRVIQHDEELAATPTIALTANPGPVTDALLKQPTCVALLNKPLQATEMAQAISRALAPR